MTPAKRLRRIGLTVLVVILIALWFTPERRQVDHAVAERGPVRSSFEAEGRTRVRDRYVLSAPVAAVARRLVREPGDAVRAGETLVELDALGSAPLDPRSRAEAEARLAAAKARESAALAARDAADTAARQARVDADRLKSLARTGVVAAEQAEHAESTRRLREREAASARFQAAAAAHEAELAAATLAIARGGDNGALSLTAPVDGLLLRRHFESARPVAIGEALLEVGDPASLEIEVDVLSADAVRLGEGMAVEILRWGEDAPLAGRVRRIEPAGFTKVSALGVEEQRVWVMVAIDSPRERWQRLGDGYRVSARFIVDAVDDALRIPASALFRDAGGWAVFRVEGQRARRRSVQVGRVGEGFAEAREGLTAGDRVVVHPEHGLGDGAWVRLR